MIISDYLCNLRRRKRIHRYREYIGGRQRWRGVSEWTTWMKVVKRYKLPVIDKYGGCNARNDEIIYRSVNIIYQSIIYLSIISVSL